MLAGVASLSLAGVALLAQAPKQKPGLEPPSAQVSDLKVSLQPVGTMPVHVNPASPVVAGSNLLLIDQSGFLYRWDGRQAEELLSPKKVPAGVKLAGAEPLLNVAASADGSAIYVVFTSATVPKNIPTHPSPREPDAWLVLYAYSFDGASLGPARPILAMQVRTDGHMGGGLVALPDGSLLIAFGDNGDSFEDGRDHPQNINVHLGKILRIDPMNGAARVVASGVRCVQRLTLVTAGSETWLAFADPGGWISEEVNAVRLDDLLNAPTPLDFGWGRAADGKAREGTFYIDKEGNSIARIADAEDRFVDPVTQYGRDGAPQVAVSGPVASAKSLRRISLLFGDLPSGDVFAITDSLAKRRQPPLRVNLVDEMMAATTLKALAGGRPDPRFFNFPDGSAGVLLEKTGVLYRVTEL